MRSLHEFKFTSAGHFAIFIVLPTYRSIIFEISECIYFNSHASIHIHIHRHNVLSLTSRFFSSLACCLLSPSLSQHKIVQVCAAQTMLLGGVHVFAGLDGGGVFADSFSCTPQ